MAPPTRKRRAQSDIRGPDGQSPPQRRRTQGTQASKARRNGNGESSTQGASRRDRRQVEASDDENSVSEQLDGDLEADAHGEMHKDRLVKNVVRLVLAHEYSRQPIRRQDITTKVLGIYVRQFKDVFDAAQKHLKEVFGMELVELPMRDRTKLSQRRAAQTQDKSTSTSKSYILTNILPSEYRDVDLVEPFGFKEQSYTGLVTMVVSLIYLNNRMLSANKLERYLRRMNADMYTPFEKTDKLLQTMQRHGYIVKVRDTAGDESSYDYHIGPRGKLEIGVEGITKFVGSVYGVQAPQDLEERVKRNVGVEIRTVFEGEEEEEAGAKGKKKAPAKTPVRAPARRATRRRPNPGEDSGDDE